MKKYKLTFALILLILSAGRGFAQTSIMPDISEEYLEKLIDVAKANYPTVKANQTKVELAKTNVGKASMAYFDAFNLSYIYQPRPTVINGTNTGTGAATQQIQINGFQAGIVFSLGAYLEKPFAVKTAKQELLIATDDQETYFLTLTANVKRRYYAYIQAIENLKLQTQTTQNTQDIFDDVKHKFEKGEETFENYTRAQLGLTASYQAKIAAETALLNAKTDLEELLGEKLEDVK